MKFYFHNVKLVSCGASFLFSHIVRWPISILAMEFSFYNVKLVSFGAIYLFPHVARWLISILAMKFLFPQCKVTFMRHHRAETGKSIAAKSIQHFENDPQNIA